MELIVRGFLVIHDFVVEGEKIFGRYIMEDGRAEAIKECRHARTTGVVVAGQFQKVGIPRGLRKVLFGSKERAEGHVLLNVESEWLLRSKGLPCSIQFRSDLVVAVGPERLPAQNFQGTEATVARTRRS